MIGAFDTTSSLTQTDFYVVYIFSVCQLIGIFFLIRLSFVYRSSPIIQVQSLPARPQTTIKNRKDEQGGRSTFGRLNLKTDEKKRKRKQGGQNFWKPEEVQWCACASVIRAILFQSLMSENRMLWSNSVMSREHSKTAAPVLKQGNKQNVCELDSSSVWKDMFSFLLMTSINLIKIQWQTWCPEQCTLQWLHATWFCLIISNDSGRLNTHFPTTFFYDILLANVGKINCNISDNEKTLVFFCSVLVFFEMKKTRFFLLKCTVCWTR